MDRYGRELTDKIEQAALAALEARRPGMLSWAVGKVGFAMNRRPIKEDGKCPGLGVNPNGAVDHSMPLLRVTDPDGKLRAVLLNYACHGTTLVPKHNFFHGDWIGCAMQYIEAEQPGVTALVSIGCGADANPEPRGELPMAEQHGRTVAAEVKRLLAGRFMPLAPKVSARRKDLQLPFEPLPTREDFAKRVAAGKAPKAGSSAKRLATHAERMLAVLDRDGKLPAGIDYSVTTWTFGDDLAMVFLPGEVVVDYALRLKSELDGKRLWVSAYTNDCPCYIVTRKILEQGGYEPDTSMIGYGRPAKLAPTVEDQLVNTIEGLIPSGFRAAK